MKTDLVTNPEFKFDIVELKPANQYKTVSIINCDLNLDFEAPLDYEEPPEPTLEKKSSSLVMENGKKCLIQELETKEFKEFQGKHIRLDGKALKDDVVPKKEEYDPRKHRLPRGVRASSSTEAFSGKGYKIK